MAVARETVRLGLSARAAAKVKLRQPLREAVVVAAGRERDGDRAPGGRRARASSTSRRCASSRPPTSSAPTRSSPTTARSARASARRCRRSPPPSRRSTPRTSPTALREGRAVGVAIDGHDHELERRRPRCSRCTPLEGYQLEREGSHAVALELALDDELRREGLAREVVHAVQNARKAAGPGGRGPHRAGARRRRRAAGRGARARGLPRGRGARHRGRLRRRARRRGGDHRGPRAAHRRRARVGRALRHRLCAAVVPSHARAGRSRRGAPTVVA